MNEDINWSEEVMRARSASGMTVQQFAHHLGVRASQLGAIERGQLLPDHALAERLLRALHCAVSSRRAH